MPPGAPAHNLGPHVVGRRVVVRRVLRGHTGAIATGPSGGPAMTDVLGVCTSWGPVSCVVQPADGEPVTIALADVVSGKPVPPRPSVRLRISAAEAQRRAMALFGQLHTQPLGDWTLRHSATHGARRANSVLAMAPSGLIDDPTGQATYDAVVDWYAGLGRRPIAAVLRDTDAERLFLSHGWVPESADADTVFQLGSVATALRFLRSHPPAGSRPTADLAGDDAVVTASFDDRASGIAALDADWVGFRTISVDPHHRRRGLGLAVMSALLDWAAERGADTAYLQVLGDNQPALALYAGLGFLEHHRYRYLAAPTGEWLSSSPVTARS